MIMKKIYLLALIAFGCYFNATAQFTDDAESYTIGNMGFQNVDVWGVWSGSPNDAEDIDIVDVFSNSGTQSLYVDDSNVMDALMLFGNKTTGTWVVQWQMYIPAGKTGYFNIQGETNGEGAGTGADGNLGIFNSPNLVFNNTESINGAPGLGGAYPTTTDDNPTYSWSYPEDTWFPITIVFDLGNLTWQMNVNGTDIDPQPFNDDSVLGAIDFFSLNSNNEYYIDDIIFAEDSLGAEDFNEDEFSVYPNPVINKLNINSTSIVDAVAVYDILGKAVINTTPGIASPTIDMSGLNSGVYLVNVVIGDTSKTLKVIK